MSTHTPIHPEVLTHEGKKLLPNCRSFRRFYLAGGTALALQLGHRVSEDFDFFYPRSLPRGLLAQVEDVFVGHRQRLQVTNANELTLLVGHTKVTFLAYPFPLRHPVVSWQGIRLANVADVATMKAYVIGRWGALKDYVDMHAILQAGWSLAAIMRAAERTYGDGFNIRLFLEQLVYLEDVPNTRLRFLGSHVTRSVLRKFFSEEIQKLKL